MQRITPYFVDAVTVDTRDNAIKYFADAQQAELDDKGFNKALHAAMGRFNKPILVTETIVSHYGYVNDNMRFYTPSFGKYNAASLIKPVPKPVLINHDRYEPALGRVMISNYQDIVGLTERQIADLKTRTGFIRAFSYIAGDENIERVMDERYLTVSIGGVSTDVRCSICDANIIQEDCEHRLGEIYDKKLCYLKYGPQEYREFSYVNAPADKEAGTRRYEIVAPQDSLVSDYAELVKGAIKEGLGAMKCDDSYTAYLTDEDRKSYFSFNDSQLYTFEDIFGQRERNRNTTDSYKAEANYDANAAKDNVNQNNQSKEDEVQLSEATLEDIQKLGLYKDHISAIRKEDTGKISDLETQLKDKEAELASKDTELASKDELISEKDKTISTQKEELDKYTGAQRNEDVNKLVNLYIDLEKPLAEVKAIIDETDETKKTELVTEFTKKISERSDDSIKDAIADLSAEKAAKAQGSQSDNGGPSQSIDDDASHNNNNPKKHVDGDTTSPLARVIDDKNNH